MTEAQVVAIDADVVTVTLVLCALGFGLFLAIWGVARSAASKQDVATLSARVEAVELKTDVSNNKMVALERQISHLPTSEHVHSIDLRLERVATTVEASARQIDRMHDHLMATSREPAGERA